MAWLQNGVVGGNAGNSSTTVTVPAGVTPTQTCIFTYSGDNKQSSTISGTPSSSNGSAVLTTLYDTVDVNNSTLSVFKATGITAGDTLTVTTIGNTHGCLSHFYFDADMVVIGTMGTRGGVTQSYVTAPAITVMAGSTIYVYAMSRVPSTDSLSSIVNSNGDTLTQLYSNYTTTAPAVNVNLYQFTEPTTDTGTTTVTESASNGNAAAFHFAESLALTMVGTAWLTL